VAATARAVPERLAMSGETHDLTYGELNELIDRLATELATCGVMRGDLVGLRAGRSPDTVAALLAINRCGAAFLPLDPEYPMDRLSYMLRHSGCALVVTDDASSTTLGDVRVVGLRSLIDAPARHVPPPAPVMAADDLAYVIYTSGSTGQPKGVMIGTGAMTHFAQTAPVSYGLRYDDRVLQFFPLSFDGGIEEVCATLGYGASLILKREAMSASFSAFETSAADLRVSIMHLPPAFWHAWCDFRSRGMGVPMPHLRLVLLGGERLETRAAVQWTRDPDVHARVLNVYGATEGTMFTTLGSLSVENPFEQRVGLPMPGTAVYVLDDERAPVASGEPGEAYIGGAGVGLGYLRRPRQTAEAFVPDPFAGDGRRMYRTGDILREAFDGSLVFVGRIDWQVKVNGFRIDPDEVAAALADHPRVQSAAVLAFDGDLGSAQLTAFVEPREDAHLSAAELANFSASRLPAFMVPAHFVFVDRMPIAPGGKIDRTALAELNAETARPAVESGSSDVALVEQLWTKALGLRAVTGSFTECGGSSLQAMRLAGQIEFAYGLRIPAADILQSDLPGLVLIIRRASIGSPPVTIQPVEGTLSWATACTLTDIELSERFHDLYGVRDDD
jgi:amino acid adenylation domain-containing protein